MKRISRAAVTVAMLVSMPTAACTYRSGSAVNGAERAAVEDTVRGEVFTTSLPQNYDRSLQEQVQLAQSSDKPTIRQQENVRSGGTSTGGSNSPAPNTSGSDKK